MLIRGLLLGLGAAVLVVSIVLFVAARIAASQAFAGFMVTVSLVGFGIATGHSLELFGPER